jgi:hypothetical protein
MALKGNLKDFSTTQLLNLISLAKKSGMLRVERSDQVANLSFRDGKLVFASLGDGDGSLTSVLAKANKLTKEQAKAINERAKIKMTGDKELGLLLINAGQVTQADIVRSIKQHVLDVVYKLFAWSEGAFQFEADKKPPDNRIAVPIDLENVIIEGARRIKEKERLREELPNLDMALKFPDRPSNLGKVNLSVEEWKVVSFIKPTNTIRQIAKANSMSDDQIRRIVYSLREAGLVELMRPQGTGALVGPGGRVRARARGVAPVQRSVVQRVIERIRSL